MNKIFLIDIPPPLPGSRIWVANKRINWSQPKRFKTKVIITDLQSEFPLKNRRKVDALRFFPHFCKVLAQHSIGSVFVHDIAALEQSLQSDNYKTILINLIDEEGGEIGIYKYSNDLMSKFDAVFNSVESAKIIRDKKVTNKFMTANGILMPKLGGNHNGRVFSQPKTGYSSQACLLDGVNQASSDRYNTEFIDTTFQFGGKKYYTCVRIMCIGSNVIKILALARDCEERNPEVRDLNTPKDSSLLRNLYKNLVMPNLHQIMSLGQRIGHSLGPGFYAHDALIDTRSGLAYLCETEFKFFPRAFMKRFRNILKDDEDLFSVCNQKAYAQYAASHFVNFIKTAL